MGNGSSIEEVYEKGVKYYREKQYDDCFNLMTELVNRNCREAYYTLGDLYYFGYGCSKDFKKAAECYSKSYDLGFKKGLYALGTVQIDPASESVFNFAEGMKNLNKAYSENVNEALFHIGVSEIKNGGISKCEQSTRNCNDDSNLAWFYHMVKEDEKLFSNADERAEFLENGLMNRNDVCGLILLEDHLKREQFDKVEKILDILIELRPNFAPYLGLRGVLKLEFNKDSGEEAVKFLERAVNLETVYPEFESMIHDKIILKFFYGVAIFKNGDLVKSEEFLNQCEDMYQCKVWYPFVQYGYREYLLGRLYSVSNRDPEQMYIRSFKLGYVDAAVKFGLKLINDTKRGLKPVSTIDSVLGLKESLIAEFEKKNVEAEYILAWYSDNMIDKLERLCKKYPIAIADLFYYYGYECGLDYEYRMNKAVGYLIQIATSKDNDLISEFIMYNCYLIKEEKNVILWQPETVFNLASRAYCNMDNASGKFLAHLYIKGVGTEKDLKKGYDIYEELYNSKLIHLREFLELTVNLDEDDKRYELFRKAECAPEELDDFMSLFPQDFFKEKFKIVVLNKDYQDNEF